MPNKNFLEKYALYRKVKTEWGGEGYAHSRISFSDIPKPAINMYCDVCKSAQTFNMENEYFENEWLRFEINSKKFRELALQEKAGEIIEKPIGQEKIMRIDYLCSACNRYKITFLIRIFRDSNPKDTFLYMMKVGQFPRWEVETDKRVRKNTW